MTWHLLGLKCIIKVVVQAVGDLAAESGNHFAGDCRIHISIISKYSDLRSYIFGQVINVE